MRQIRSVVFVLGDNWFFALLYRVTLNRMRYMNNILRFILILFCCCLLPGCIDEGKIDPRVAALDGRILLTYGAYDLTGGTGINKFSVMLSQGESAKDPATFISRGRYNGYIAALIPGMPGNSGVEIIFHDGSVFAVNDTDFTQLEQVLESSGRMEILTAARIGGEILAFGREDEQSWKFYRLSKSGWEESAIPSPVLSIAQLGIAELVEYKAQPAFFWREAVGRRVEGIIRAAVYAGQNWEYLPEVGMDLPLSGGFAVCGGKDKVLLLQDTGGKKSASDNGMPLYEYSADGWRSLADIPFPQENLALAGFGIDIKQIAGRYVVTRADEAGVQVYFSENVEDGIWKGVEQFEEEERAWTEIIYSEVILNYALIALSVVLLLVLLRRRKRLKATLEAQANAGGEVARDPRLSKLLKEAGIQRIGGYASVIDRGFALFIDGFLVMPVLYFYLNAENLDFMDSIFAAREMTLFFIWLLALVGYLLLSEMIFGQSVGKAVTRIRVRSATGGRAAAYQILLRNTARFIDFFPIPLGGMRIWYLIAVIAASVTSRRQRIGDILGKTVVRRYTSLSKRKIVLASASPRRSELLSEYGLSFTVSPAEVDESVVPGMPPREFARMLAVRKASAVASRMDNGELVIAADTVVALDNQILGKPQDEAEARRMLGELSGRRHEVLTGVCILDTAINQMVVSVERTEVEFRDLAAAEIEEYIASGECMDKAGSYAIQGRAGLFVTATLGSTSNVIGMPMELFRRMLKDLDAS